MGARWLGGYSSSFMQVVLLCLQLLTNSIYRAAASSASLAMGGSSSKASRATRTSCD